MNPALPIAETGMPFVPVMVGRTDMNKNNFGLAWLMGIARRWRVEPGEPATVHTVLIVDDEDSILRFVQRVLQEAGCRTFIAHDGAEAVTLAATINDLDLLVTDLMMPTMNGDELARRLRATDPDLPVLYLTGFSDRLFADRMQLWQSEAFLDKRIHLRQKSRGKFHLG